MNVNQTVEQVVAKLGGAQNIGCVTNCMTRLRITVHSEADVDEKGLKCANGVLGVVHDRPTYYEVVVGPGASRKCADLCHEMGLPATEAGNDWKANKAARSQAQGNGRIKGSLKVLADIFVPLIPGIIVAGLCAGFASLLTQLVPNYADIIGWSLLYKMLVLVNVSFMTYITAWSGYRAAERFGGTPILGGMLGMVTTLSGINEIAQALGLYDSGTPLNSVLLAGKGGVLAVIFGVFLMCLVEKQLRKKMPANLDVVFTPLLTMLICMVPYVLIIMPVFGYISSGIAWALGEVCMSDNVYIRAVTGFIAAAVFLPLVAFGMHYGIIALYTVQLQQLGHVTLYPALAMAGAGQIGAALAIYVKARRLKHKKLCSVIEGALPAGLLGVGEPLIYGVTLPMGRPFLTAGLGAGFGGAFVMVCQVSSTTWGPSDLLGCFVMTAGEGGPLMSIAMYLVGLVISYIAAFIITNIAISDADVAEALGGVEPDGDMRAEVGKGSTTNDNDTKEASSAVEAEAKGSGSSAECEPPRSPHRRVKHGEPVRLPIVNAMAGTSFGHTVHDPIGIHARPAGEIAQAASAFAADVTVECAGRTANAKSVIELMKLEAVAGSVLAVRATGPDAKEAIAALKRLLDEKL